MTHFDKRFTGPSGTVTLMEDLGDALNQNPDMIFMGGGNPAQIAAVESCVAEHLQSIASNPHILHKLLGEYQPPQGDPLSLSVMAEFLHDQYAWDITEKNIAISNGGQSAFFILFNMLAGQSSSKHDKKILLPMVPDYLGYADAGLTADMFQGLRPAIQLQGEHFFKYTIDFDHFELNESIAAVCLSRPSNPSGNIVTDAEMERLANTCRRQSIPLIVDGAYGKPFPNITFVEHTLNLDDNMIVVLSLSKLGLPGVRTGIVIGHENLIKKFSRATASLSLSPGSLGPTLCRSLIMSGDLSRLMQETIKPYYQDKLEQTLGYLLQKIQHLPVKIHKPEGAFFLWLWFQDLPISSQALYERLKHKGLLVVSGHHFFKPLGDTVWSHRDECLRLSYCQPWERIEKGIDILALEVAEIYESMGIY